MKKKQNREITKGYSRWKVEYRHGKFEEYGLNNWSKSKSQNGGMEPGVQKGVAKQVVLKFVKI